MLSKGLVGLVVLGEQLPLLGSDNFADFGGIVAIFMLIFFASRCCWAQRHWL